MVPLKLREWLRVAALFSKLVCCSEEKREKGLLLILSYLFLQFIFEKIDGTNGGKE